MLVASYIVGGITGFFVCAILTAGRQSDLRDEIGRLRGELANERSPRSTSAVLFSDVGGTTTVPDS